MGDVDINVLPVEFVERREISAKPPFVAAALLLLWVALGLFYYGYSRATERLKREEHLGADQLKVAQRYDRMYKLQAEKIELEKLQKIGELVTVRDYWARAYDAIARGLPEYMIAGGSTGITTVEEIPDELLTRDEQMAFGRRRDDGRPYDPDRDVGRDRDRGGGRDMRRQQKLRREHVEYVLKFIVETEAKYTEIVFNEDNLVKTLESITVYPERIKLFKLVKVTEPERDTARADRDIDVFEVRQQDILRATVYCLAKKPEEIGDELAKLRGEAAPADERQETPASPEGEITSSR